MRFLKKKEEKKEKEGKTFVYIDSENLAAVEEKEKVNWKSFFNHLLSERKEAKIFFYWSYSERLEEKSKPFERFLVRLRNQVEGPGIEFIEIKVPTIEKVDSSGKISRVSKVDLAIVCDMAAHLLYNDPVKEIILGSGDGDFYKLLKAAKFSKKAKITVISRKERCAQELRDIADEVHFLEEIREIFKEN
ncbi:MAG: NYN domain-containing protein [Patescibacteria group bacterium]|nr:NYN domain-containing protein [Patescibacteria group bacterium]